MQPRPATSSGEPRFIADERGHQTTLPWYSADLSRSRRPQSHREVNVSNVIVLVRGRMLSFRRRPDIIASSIRSSDRQSSLSISAVSTSATSASHKLQMHWEGKPHAALRKRQRTLDNTATGADEVHCRQRWQAAWAVPAAIHDQRLCSQSRKRSPPFLFPLLGMANRLANRRAICQRVPTNRTGESHSDLPACADQSHTWICRCASCQRITASSPHTTASD